MNGNWLIAVLAFAACVFGSLHKPEPTATGKGMASLAKGHGQVASLVDLLPELTGAGTYKFSWSEEPGCFCTEHYLFELEVQNGSATWHATFIRRPRLEGLLEDQSEPRDTTRYGMVSRNGDLTVNDVRVFELSAALGGVWTYNGELNWVGPDTCRCEVSSDEHHHSFCTQSPYPDQQEPAHQRLLDFISHSLVGQVKESLKAELDRTLPVQQ